MHKQYVIQFVLCAGEERSSIFENGIELNGMNVKKNDTKMEIVAFIEMKRSPFRHFFIQHTHTGYAHCHMN